MCFTSCVEIGVVAGTNIFKSKNSELLELASKFAFSFGWYGVTNGQN